MRLRRILVVLLVLTLFFALWLPSAGPRIDDGSILVLDVSGAYVESVQPPLLTRLLGAGARPFVSLLSEISKAERDERLAAVVFRIRNLDIGWGKAQELRDAIASASSRGRRTVAYLELASFNANLEYYVASAAQQVYAAPASRGPVVGLAARYLFFGGLWEKLGIELEVERIGRYKSAAETFAGKQMSESAREMANSLLDSVDEQFMAGIAEGRGLPVASVREAVDAAPVDPEGMLRWGLIDGVLHEDELTLKLGGGEVVRGREYAAVDPKVVGFSPVSQFALIYGTGSVVVGSGRLTPDGSPVLASDTVSRALERATDDPEIDAIIFRVDSPGGSPLASDIVLRATERARAQGKPIIASFSDVAASGGYYVAVGADVIVASPASITGSIGVFALRPVIGGALDKLGVGFETLTRSDHADLQLDTSPLLPGSREVLRAEVESIYALFVERVAKGRSLETEAVDAVGQGRVWTGAQAAEVGLVDKLGGLRTAVGEGKRRLGLDEDADVVLVVYPPPRSLYEQVDDLLRGLAAGWSPALPLKDAVRRAAPWLRALADGAPTALIPFVLEIH